MNIIMIGDMSIKLILGYVLLVAIVGLTVVTFFRIPIRYWNYFQRQWKKKKLDDKRLEVHKYFLETNFKDGRNRTDIIKKVTGQFSLHDLNIDQLNKVYEYLYENYDPKSREDKIDDILNDDNLET